MSNKKIRIKALLLLTWVIPLTIGCGKQKPDTTQDYGPQDWTMTKEAQQELSPKQLLQIAKTGNHRFVTGQEVDRDRFYDQKVTAEGQHPAAIILSCIDSRAPAEIIFDLGIGDIFNARIAGNFVNPDIAGSIEYACYVAGAKLVIVMGHTHCGAIKSACDNVELGNITGLLANIKPAVNAVRDIEGERNSKNAEFVAAVAKQNVLLSIEKIKLISPIMKEMVDNDKVVIVGCMYDIESGKVEFIDQ